MRDTLCSEVPKRRLYSWSSLLKKSVECVCCHAHRCAEGLQMIIIHHVHCWSAVSQVARSHSPSTFLLHGVHKVITVLSYLHSVRDTIYKIYSDEQGQSADIWWSASFQLSIHIIYIVFSILYHTVYATHVHWFDCTVQTRRRIWDLGSRGDRSCSSTNSYPGKVDLTNCQRVTVYRVPILSVLWA